MNSLLNAAERNADVNRQMAEIKIRADKNIIIIECGFVCGAEQSNVPAGDGLRPDARPRPLILFRQLVVCGHNESRAHRRAERKHNLCAAETESELIFELRSGLGGLGASENRRQTSPQRARARFRQIIMYANLRASSLLKRAPDFIIIFHILRIMSEMLNNRDGSRKECHPCGG